MNSVTTYTIDHTQAGTRLDAYLHQNVTGYSRTFFKNLIQEGHITVNGTPAKPAYALKAQDLITVTINPMPTIQPANIATHHPGITVLYEHPHFLVINKPAGLIVHKASTSSECTLVDWLRMTRADVATVGTHDRPGIVHRLDKDTSGIMVIARTAHALAEFGKLFATRTIQKTYLALVHGHPTATGTIDLSIGRHPKHRHKMATQSSGVRTTLAGTVRDACTMYRVVQYFDNATLLELHPKTGRTHQIRVHCAALGHPLIGDAVYGQSSPLIQRHALHAAELSFIFDGTPYHFCSPVPEDFTHARAQL